MGEAINFESGKIYVMEMYEGTCHNCGGDVRFPWMFVMYIGHYVNSWGREYDSFRTCLYTLCPTCRAFIDYIERYQPMEAPALFRKGAIDGQSD